MRVLRLVLATMLLSSLAAPASARWPHDPITGGVPVCTATGNQSTPQIIADGSGGTFLVWTDARSDGGDIYAQRLDPAGTPLWTPEGVLVCGAIHNQYLPALVSDGTGGAIVTWADLRGSSTDLYAQRLDGDGTRLWTTDGVVVSATTNIQSVPCLVPDDSGGAIIAWQDLRSGSSYDVYAQRISATGAALWATNGVALTMATGQQYLVAIAPDGARGAIVAWTDGRSGTNDIYARRVNASGTPMWTADGLAVCTAVGSQAAPQLVPDGLGGAIVAWADPRSGSYDLYAQRLGPLGELRWVADGVPVCVASGDQIELALLADGAGGCFAAWCDYRSGSAYDIYAQRLTAAGAPVWTVNGIGVCVAAQSQLYPALDSDGAGGVLVVWEDARVGPDHDIYAQRITREGATRWTADGAIVSAALDVQQYPVACGDGSGGLVTTWYDSRGGANQDVYAQRVDAYGFLGSAAPVIASVRDVRNDEGGQVKLSWDASYLDLAGGSEVTAYDLWRSVPSTVAQAKAARGARQVSTLTEAYAEPGATLLGAAGYAWEYVATQTAFHYVSTYSVVAATEGDSVAGSNPLTAFMVVARDGAGTRFWTSAPDSGYSVDDLAPPAPAPFAGAYALSGTALTWQASPAADFASFRLYRGATSSFTPGPANLVVSTAATGHVDAAGQPYWYKLSAVDVHGNESAFATLLPSGSLAVEGTLPTALALAAPAPNPARSLTTLAFALPRAARVRLALHDASGRLVRTLVDGAREAGAHTAAWDLRDEAGRAVGAGLYFATLEADGRRLTRRVMTLR
jgi:hypothetical protein